MGLPLLEILNIIGTQYPDAMSILQQPGVARSTSITSTPRAGSENRGPKDSSKQNSAPPPTTSRTPSRFGSGTSSKPSTRRPRPPNATR